MDGLVVIGRLVDAAAVYSLYAFVMCSLTLVIVVHSKILLRRMAPFASPTTLAIQSQYLKALMIQVKCSCHFFMHPMLLLEWRYLYPSVPSYRSERSQLDFCSMTKFRFISSDIWHIGCMHKLPTASEMTRDRFLSWETEVPSPLGTLSRLSLAYALAARTRVG